MKTALLVAIWIAFCGFGLSAAAVITLYAPI